MCLFLFILILALRNSKLFFTCSVSRIFTVSISFTDLLFSDIQCENDLSLHRNSSWETASFDISQSIASMMCFILSEDTLLREEKAFCKLWWLILNSSKCPLGKPLGRAFKNSSADFMSFLKITAIGANPNSNVCKKYIFHNYLVRNANGTNI